MISQFFRNVLADEDVELKSSGEQVRSYCYVADCAVGIITAMLTGESGEAYNISNTEISIK